MVWRLQPGTTATINFFVPHGIDPGAINRFRPDRRAEYARGGAGLTVDGVAYSGEVEDYVYTIVEVDYGDAANGPTMWADDGAPVVIAGPG